MKTNRYQRRFKARCPNNGLEIEYRLTISTGDIIMVEDIVAATDRFDSAYHEAIADSLHAEFGGSQMLRAFHHGVLIVTVRTEEATRPDPAGQAVAA